MFLFFRFVILTQCYPKDYLCNIKCNSVKMEAFFLLCYFICTWNFYILSHELTLKQIVILKCVSFHFNIIKNVLISVS